MQVKNIPRAGSILQIFLSSFMGQEQFLIKFIYDTIVHIIFLSKLKGLKGVRPKLNMIITTAL